MLSHFCSLFLFCWQKYGNLLIFHSPEEDFADFLIPDVAEARINYPHCLPFASFSIAVFSAVCSRFSSA